MALTPTQSAMRSGIPPFYVWEVPGKPISIQLRFDVIDRMTPEMMRGLGALKRRGAEVGGILLGRSEPGIQTKVTIEDFEPIPTEYLTGPSYNLSQNDLEGLEAAIERREADASSPLEVVGFYRSHTRDELYMDEADMALARRYFSSPAAVFLIVKPFATRTSVGGFFFWENGDISRESSYQEFPFHRGELGGGESPRIAPPPPPRSEMDRPLPPYSPGGREMEPPPPAADEDPFSAIRNANLSILTAAQEKRQRSVPWKWIVAPGFLLLAGAVGFVALQNLSEPKEQPAPPPVIDTALPLRLSVSDKEDQLEVTWDRNAPAVALAERGVLSIADGTNQRDLELTGAQLRNGRVLYSRLSGDVSLRLEVFPKGRESVSESIRIVSADPAPKPLAPAPAPPPAAEAPKPAPRPAAQAPKPVAPKSAPPRQTAPPPAASKPPAAEPAQSAPPPKPEPEPEIELQRPARRR